ncbi:transglutaminase domain-containing protein [Reichenbachiella sp. MALMAid0571]|uniref:transglutaminase domain-containing protein n=1 Tax=Reichenbachiella sp. MALMAid0571 TaxID=3143939 RepID=UPI0032DE8B8E
MKLAKPPFALVLIFLLIPLAGYSEKPPIKFGDVPLEQLKMKLYEKDTNANAVILMDYGTSHFDYGNDQFQVIFERHVRIKIINKDGYAWADHEVMLYNSDGRKEVFSGLKGVTYNLDGSKVEKTKLEKESIFNENVDDNYDKVKFTMPNVKEGSIIEFTYSIRSDFYFNYRGWQFQYQIPVAWSEYRASFIEYYRYQKNFQGYIPMFIQEQESGRQSFTIRVSSGIDPVSGERNSGYTNDYDAQNVINRWVAKDVPAFISEPYMTTSKNYISRVSFELESTKFPNQPIRYLRGTWEEVNKQFLDYDFFGGKVESSGFLKKELDGIISDQDSEEDRVNKIYAFVKKKVKWNGNKTKYLESNLKKPYDDGEGSSAEINLLLTSMLKKAGINADPVIISTRDHGMVRTHIAVSSQFNYVICKVQLGENIMLLDATEPYLPITALPERCLNGQGYVISETNHGWVDIPSTYNKSTKVGGEINITEDGELSGFLHFNFEGYNGLSERKKYFSKGQEDFITDLKSNSKWEIEKIEVENEQDYDKPFVVKYDAEINSGVESLGDIIYLDPLLSGKYEKNPFSLEKREYPIDFSCPIEEVYYVTYTLPEGYQLEAPVKPFTVLLPDRAGRFVYSVMMSGGKLIVMSKLNIYKTLFVMNEYAYIKEFFAQIVAKQNEQLVLKKV